MLFVFLSEHYNIFLNTNSFLTVYIAKKYIIFFKLKFKLRIAELFFQPTLSKLNKNA